VLDFSPLKPRILTGDPLSGRYATPCREFSLCVLRGKGRAAPLQYRESGASILIVTEGEPELPSGETFPRGMSVFILPEDTVSLAGDFTAYAASIPAPAAPPSA
ncbi:MAG: hypothetical protein LBG42_00655, partial [Treponema sp.]|nr:hypothetical protein [Treponema sp.]